MSYAARVLTCLAASACAGALAFQAVETAMAQPAGATCPSGTLAVQTPQPLAPLRNEESPLKIAGSYIVVLQPNTSQPITAAVSDGILKAAGANNPSRTYTTAILGYRVQFPAQPTAGQLNQLRQLPCVDYVEADLQGSYNQAPVPRGLDRIDQRTAWLDHRTYNRLGDGTGVHVYVIDSGIDINETEFKVGSMKRASEDYSEVCPGSIGACMPVYRRDCNGHGTAAAGVIGGDTVGVAKNVWLHSVRVSDRNCQLSALAMVGGVEWVMEDVRAEREKNPNYLAVVNMSLSVGPGRDQALDDAVTKLIRTHDVTFVNSAGNRHLDACGFSPGGGALETITAGAFQTEGIDIIRPTLGDYADSEPAFNNFGTCVDLFAPGVAIRTVKFNGRERLCDDGLAPPPVGAMDNLRPPRQGMTLCSGTSMAAAHVSGCVAVYLERQKDPLMRTREAVRAWLMGRANQGILSGELDEITNPTPPDDIKYRHPGTTNLSLYCGPDDQK